MNNLNSLLIEGYIAKVPEKRPTINSDTKLSVMRIVSKRYYKTETGFEGEDSFFEVEMWGRLAEAVLEKAKKGRGVRIVGRLKQDRWDDPDTGKFREKVKIIAETVEFRPQFKKEEIEKIPEETA